MSETFNLKDKIVVIAGGTGLIGRELCKGFADQGSNVVFTSRDETKGKKIENTRNNTIVSCELDISNEESVDTLISSVLERFSKIDVFINCSWPKTKDWITNVEEVRFESVKENLLNHLGGYFLCTQKMAVLMKKQRKGSIVNFSSIYGMVGPNFSIYDGTELTSPPAYPMIKGGIISMTKYFATYFAKYNVRVNCISPGGIFNGEGDTFVNNYSQLTPLGRMGNANEIVGPTLLLASDSSSYITGHNLVIDGGWTVW